MNEMYKRIETLCKDRGVNMTKMCKDTNIPRGNLTDLKMGRTAALSTKTLGKISVYFEVPMDYLLGNDEIKQNIIRKEVELKYLRESLTGEKEKPADQKADRLEKAGYYDLTPENRAMIDSLIDSLLKSQSGE